VARSPRQAFFRPTVLTSSVIHGSAGTAPGPITWSASSTDNSIPMARNSRASSGLAPVSSRTMA
jgi:hypothetical protein